MMRYTLAGFAALGTRQSRAVEVAGESATVDATRSFVAASRHAEVEAPGSGAVDASAYRVADPSYLIPGMRRFSLSRYGMPGTLQSRGVAVECAGGSLDATRSFAAAPRTVAVEAPLEVLLDAQAYLAAAPSYLVPGARRYGVSRYTFLGTLQSRPVSVEGAAATLAATRGPLVAADRLAAIAAAGGYLAGRSYAVPDVSGGVNATFEEVYPV